MKSVTTLLLLSLFGMMTGCMADDQGSDDDETDDDVGAARESLAFYAYSAAATNSAQDPNNTAQIPVIINGGETVMIGTTEIRESFFIGDTYLRLKNQLGQQVGSNDNFCGSLGSMVAYTSTNPPMTSSTFKIWAGCAGSTACGGNPNPNIVAISKRKDNFPFSTSNTNSATTNTYNKQYYFNGGETIRAGTCGAFAYGGSASGDTMLRIFKVGPGPSFTEVASNDNALSPNVCSCGTSSLIKYTVTTPGFYQVRAGCSANGTCSGSVAVYVE